MQTPEFRSQIRVGRDISNIKLSSFRADTTKESSQLIRNEVGKLKELNMKIGQVLRRIQSNKAQCQQTINSLKTQITELDQRVSIYQTQQINSNIEQQERDKIKSLQNEFVGVCKQRIKLANEISIKNLCKIEIEDKKSKANEIFKWVLAAIYNQASNKFYWPNFRQEALQNDKGKDFIERLGKVSSANLKQQQKIKTEQFLLKYKDYAAQPQLQDAKEDIEKIHQIAQEFEKGYAISLKIKEKQESIEKHKETTMEKDEQFVRWKARSEALKERVEVNEKYLKILAEAERKLEPKVISYSEMAKKGEKLQLEFEAEEQWKPSLNLGRQQKTNCECRIF